ncbi:MAG: ATP synthase F1 subunit delta [Bacillota bacterium]
MGTSVRYAQALAGLARERGLSNAVLSQLLAFSAALSETGVSLAALSPGERDRLIDHLLPGDGPSLARAFLHVLAKDGAIDMLPEVVETLADIVEGKHRQIRVTSAVPLSAQEKRYVLARVRALAGADVSVQYAVDPGVLGGVVIAAGDTEWDFSVRGAIARMRDEVTHEY